MTTPEARRRLRAASRVGRVTMFCVVSLVICGASAWLVAGSREQKQSEKPYALIYGTVYGPNDLTVYGVRILIRRAEQKKPKWELWSNHAGEFAQRVPAGRADYVVRADLKGSKLLNGKKLAASPEVVVHIENDERSDISLHLK